MRLAHERVAEHADPDLCHRAILRSRDRTDRRLVSGTRQVGHRLDRAHQPSGDSGRESVAEGRPRRRREPRPGARGRVCARVGDPARARLVRGAARRPGDRGGVHLAAEQPALSSGRSARSRPASTCSCEKPFTRAPDDVEEAFDAAERADRVLSEAFMYRHNPQTKRVRRSSKRARSASCASSARPSATPCTTSRTSACAPDVDGGALMDVGCYCVSGSRLVGRRAGDGVRPGVVRALRDRLGVRRDVAVPG